MLFIRKSSMPRLARNDLTLIIIFVKIVDNKGVVSTLSCGNANILGNDPGFALNDETYLLLRISLFYFEVKHVIF